MSVVKINAITIQEGTGPQLEERFAGRAKMVERFEESVGVELRVAEVLDAAVRQPLRGPAPNPPLHRPM